MKPVHIIGAASGVGAPDHGCAKGPWALQHSHAFRHIAHRPRVTWQETLYARPSHGDTPLALVHDLCERLCVDVRDALVAGTLPVVVGGDHSCAIGTWSGVHAFLGAGQAPGLLWLDAHMDSHTPETTYSGAINGMPLACLLGVGDRRLVEVGGAGPKLQPEHTVLLGVRSYEPEEAEFLERMGVRVMAAPELSRRGFDACFAEALEVVRQAAVGFGISIDLDVFEPRRVPGVGSAEPCGLQPEPVLASLAGLRMAPDLLAVEITEFNPDRDIEGRTAALLSSLIASFLPLGGDPQQ
jgi:arginase